MDGYASKQNKKHKFRMNIYDYHLSGLNRKVPGFFDPVAIALLGQISAQNCKMLNPSKRSTSPTQSKMCVKHLSNGNNHPFRNISIQPLRLPSRIPQGNAMDGDVLVYDKLYRNHVQKARWSRNVSKKKNVPTQGTWCTGWKTNKAPTENSTNIKPWNLFSRLFPQSNVTDGQRAISRQHVAVWILLALVGFEVMDAVPKRIGLRTNLPTIYESC
jgi:hypothetical protein